MDRSSQSNDGSHEGLGREGHSDTRDTNPGENALTEYLQIMESVNQLITMNNESLGPHEVVNSAQWGHSGETTSSAHSAVFAASTSCDNAAAVGGLDSSSPLEASGADGGSDSERGDFVAASSDDVAACVASASGVNAAADESLNCPSISEDLGAVGGSSPFVSGPDEDVWEVEDPVDQDPQFFTQPGKPIFVNEKPRRCEKCGDVEGIHVVTKHRACPTCYSIYKDAKQIGLVHKIR